VVAGAGFEGPVAGNIYLGLEDNIPPVITLLGQNPATAYLNHAYTDAGATASDNNDGNITTSLTTTSTVNTSILGTYAFTYTVTDAAGNQASSSRTVNVVNDTTAPVLTLLGPTPISAYQNQPYTDPGATASDNADGDLTASITTSSTLDLTTIGTYTITYSVTDQAGNQATPITRTVNVILAPTANSGGKLPPPDFTINHGVPTTSNPQVELELQATNDIRSMAFASSEQNLQSTLPIPYASITNYALCNAPCTSGPYTVYAAFTTASSSQTYEASHTITLVNGTTAPLSQTTAGGGSSYSTTQATTETLQQEIARLQQQLILLLKQLVGILMGEMK
jgi:phage gpG-like protein